MVEVVDVEVEAEVEVVLVDVVLLLLVEVVVDCEVVDVEVVLDVDVVVDVEEEVEVSVVVDVGVVSVGDDWLFESVKELCVVRDESVVWEVVPESFEVSLLVPASPGDVVAVSDPAEVVEASLGASCRPVI